jgi:hypothetical protein
MTKTNETYNWNHIENLLYSIKYKSQKSIKEYIDFLKHELTIPLKDNYYEQHHILPRSLFPEFCNFDEYPWNSINLSLKSHTVAHKLLHESFGGSMTTAYLMMNNRNPMYPSDGMSRRLKHIYSPETMIRRRILDTDELPEGFVYGTNISNKPILGKKRLINDTKNSYIYIDKDLPIPNGYSVDTEWNPIGDKLWAHDPISKISGRYKEDEIPDGWLLGRGDNSWVLGKCVYYNLSGETRQFSPDNVPDGWILGAPNAGKQTKGKLLITNGLRNKFIERDGEIPEGWWVGSRSKKPKSIHITDGEVITKISDNDEIPDGWWVAGRHSSSTRIWITNGTIAKSHIPTEKIPDGWRRGRK